METLHSNRQEISVSALVKDELVKSQVELLLRQVEWVATTGAGNVGSAAGAFAGSVVT